MRVLPTSQYYQHETKTEEQKYLKYSKIIEKREEMTETVLVAAILFRIVYYVITIFM